MSNVKTREKVFCSNCLFGVSVRINRKAHWTDKVFCGSTDSHSVGGVDHCSHENARENFRSNSPVVDPTFELNQNGECECFKPGKGKIEELTYDSEGCRVHDGN